MKGDSMKEKVNQVLAVGLGALLLTACSGPGSSESESESIPQIAADYPEYTSVAGLTATSDTAVRGHVVAEIRREVDDGGDVEPTIDPPEGDESEEPPAPEPSLSAESTSAPSGVSGDGPQNEDGLPMVFLQYYIDDVIKKGSGSTLSAGDKIIVGNIDTSAVDMEGTSKLAENQSTILYLERITDADSPGITSITQDFFVPLSGDNGIFDVSGSQATARAKTVVSLSAETVHHPSSALKDGNFTASIEQLEKVAQEVGDGGSTPEKK